MEQQITKIEITEQKRAEVSENNISFVLPDILQDENPNANSIFLVDQNFKQSDQRYLEKYCRAPNNSINPAIHSKKKKLSSSQKILKQLSTAKIQKPSDLFKNLPQKIKNHINNRLKSKKMKINKQQQSTIEGQSSFCRQKEVLKTVEKIVSGRQKSQQQSDGRGTNYHQSKKLSMKISIQFRKNTQLLKQIFTDILEEISSNVLVSKQKVQNVYEILQKEKENMPSEIKRFCDQEISTADDLFHEVKQFAITIFSQFLAAYFGFMRDISGRDMSQQLILKFQKVKIAPIARPQFLKYEKQKNSLLYLLNFALGLQLDIKWSQMTSKKQNKQRCGPDSRVFSEISRQKYRFCDGIQSIKSENEEMSEQLEPNGEKSFIEEENEEMSKQLEPNGEKSFIEEENEEMSEQLEPNRETNEKKLQIVQNSVSQEEQCIQIDENGFIQSNPYKVKQHEQILQQGQQSPFLRESGQYSFVSAGRRSHQIQTTNQANRQFFNQICLSQIEYFHGVDIYLSKQAYMNPQQPNV